MSYTNIKLYIVVFAASLVCNTCAVFNPASQNNREQREFLIYLSSFFERTNDEGIYNFNHGDIPLQEDFEDRVWKWKGTDMSIRSKDSIDHQYFIFRTWMDSLTSFEPSNLTVRDFDKHVGKAFSYHNNQNNDVYVTSLIYLFHIQKSYPCLPVKVELTHGPISMCNSISVEFGENGKFQRVWTKRFWPPPNVD